MSDHWLGAAAEAEAKLDDARRQLAQMEQELQRCRYALGIIAHDGYELSHDKVREQRDYFIKISKKALYPTWDTVAEETPISDDF
jgi:hypothetical protein